MNITSDGALLSADHQQSLAVHLESGHSVDDMRAGLLQRPRPGDVVSLVKTSLEFNQHGHLLSVFSSSLK